MRRMITAAVLACTCLLSVAVATPAQAATTAQNTLTTQAQVIAVQRTMASFAGTALLGCALNGATRQVLVASRNNVLPPVQVARAAAAVVNNTLGGGFCNAATQTAKTMALMQLTFLAFHHVYIRYTTNDWWDWFVPKTTVDQYIGPDPLHVVHIGFTY